MKGCVCVCVGGGGGGEGGGGRQIQNSTLFGWKILK